MRISLLFPKPQHSKPDAQKILPAFSLPSTGFARISSKLARASCIHFLDGREAAAGQVQ